MKLDPLSLGMTLGLIVVKLVNLIQEKGTMPSIAYLNILVISFLFSCRNNCLSGFFRGEEYVPVMHLWDRMVTMVSRKSGPLIVHLQIAAYVAYAMLLVVLMLESSKL